MAITTTEGLNAAMARKQSVFFGKTTNLANQVTGQYGSYFRVAGWPAAGNIPTTAAALNNQFLGGINYDSPSAGLSMYLAEATIHTTTGIGTSYELHDRLAHMGGLNGNITTLQTVGLDIHTTGLGGTNNITERKGRSDFTEVAWWLEIYTTLGGTISSATINFTDVNGTSKTMTQQVPANSAAGRMIQLTPNPDADVIRSIESIQLTSATGTVGNFGVTVTRHRAELVSPMTGFQPAILDWAKLRFPRIHDKSCLTIHGLANGATLIAPHGSLTLVQG